MEMNVEEYLDELIKRTVWPDFGLPAASTFYVDHRDLRLIASVDEEKDAPIKVRHRKCMSEVVYEPDPFDPIQSQYACCSSIVSWGSTSSYCEATWKLSDILKMKISELSDNFYTELIESPDELIEWPVKLCEVTSGAIRYTTTRPCTKVEILRGRCHRIFDIRKQVK